MLFTSYSFILFLVLVFIIYYVLPQRFRWMFLLAASYTFYAFAGLSFLIFISVTSVTIYFAALKIGDNKKAQKAYIKANKASLSADEKKAYKNKMKRRRKLWFMAALLLNIGALAVLKYTNFTIANINSLLTLFRSENQLNFLTIILPMGISFYTFQSVGYLIDVYWEKYEPQRNIFKFALFVSFFPQLVQGPISRYDELAVTLYEGKPFNAKTVSFGLQRILWGFFKKLVIADRIMIALKEILADTDTYTGAYVFIGMVFYAIELYADFTGGIDITIGIAETLGIKVKENFERPFFSKSIDEYWRRWHITMGTWFRDYIFYPLSVCKPMLKISSVSRKLFGVQIGKRIPVYLSTLIVWFTTGLWHGASWNFIVWGLLNGVIIIISQELSPVYALFHEKVRFSNTKGYVAFTVLRTFLLMCSLRLLDCYRNVGVSFRMFFSMFTGFDVSVFWDGSLLKLGLTYADYIVVFVGVIIMIVVSLCSRNGSVREKLSGKPYIVRSSLIAAMFVAIIIFGAYGTGYDAAQFIYNQF